MQNRHRAPAHALARVRAAFALTLVALTLVALAAPASPVAAPPTASTPAAQPTLGQALQAVTDAGLARLAALESQAKAAVDGPQVLAAQAAIIAAKEQMQRELFTVQLDYARRAGDAKLAAALEGELARLDAPAVAAPQNHPAPTDATPTPEVRR